MSEFYMARSQIKFYQNETEPKLYPDEYVKCIPVEDYEQLKKENADLKWFAAQMNKYVLPGTTDTGDSALLAFNNMAEENSKLKDKLLAFEGMTFSENAKIVELEKDLQMITRMHSQVCDVAISRAQEIDQLKKLNLLYSDDRDLYMKHRDILIDALKFYSTPPNEKVKGQIEWNPHVCDKYSGLEYSPDWDGDLQDEPNDIAVKGLKAVGEL